MTLKLENLTLRFDDQPVIRDVSFDVADGELVCLLGPSGCGKTTTLRLIAGFERPESGTITIGDQIVSTAGQAVAPQKRDVGFLFQDYALFPHLTVAENIAYGLSDRTRQQVKERTWEMLRQIRMLNHADKYPHELSGGEQQRVALARARAPRPSLLLLDEPFSGLDTSLRAKLRRETRDVLKDRGVTAIIVTHDPEEAMLMADRIVLMRDGRVVQTGTPEELYTNPVDAFTAEFFCEVNHLDGVVEGDWIKTNAGLIPNQNHPDGMEVDVLIRPEAVTLGSAAFDKALSQEVRVCAVDYAGGTSHIRLALSDGPEPVPHIQARHPGPFQSAVGDHIQLNIDQAQTFIFPKQHDA
ncbi:MAG: ATP-binding cassette domain-containing protein [Alphaproteobacteria bacterium]|nr:ATP-binding cassette domain-containing protein [Alphaproteobacteria bacterium]